MSIVNLQNKNITIGSPIEIERAINDIRVLLSSLTWVDRPYFIAEKFVQTKGGKRFVYPETYCKSPTDQQSKYPYHRLTPDNDSTGMFFFIVGDSDNAFDSEQNYIKYPVSIIFSVNLELIDSVKLDNGLFTQELIKDVRTKLTMAKFYYNFKYTIKSETRDLKQCFKEFSINDLEAYNRAPMQCFRFDLEINILEDCI